MNESFWKSVSMPRFTPLSESIEVDVLIVGGGNTETVSAYLLKQAGLRVALIERDRCCQVNTGNTTAHLTYVTDLSLQKLVSSHGRDHAQAVWDAGQAAINQIEGIVSTEQIACEFTRIPSYIHASILGDKDESKRVDMSLW